MDQPQNFRSAFNGFNREDVIKYLEYLNSKHASTYNQLTAEMQLLRQKLDTVSSEEVAELQVQCAEMEQKLADAQTELEGKTLRVEELEAENQKLEQRNAELEAQLAEANEALSKAEKERDDASQRAGELETKANQELEAYRRAERAERIARERADQIYRHTNGTLADATKLVDQASDQIDSVADQILDHMKVLQSAITGSRQAMRDAAQTLYKLRPDAEEE